MCLFVMVKVGGLFSLLHGGREGREESLSAWSSCVASLIEPQVILFK